MVDLARSENYCSRVTQVDLFSIGGPPFITASTSSPIKSNPGHFRSIVAQVLAHVSSHMTTIR
jgi:hypothetical protein